MLEVVILAAGKGSRMKSSVPKVMHRLAGKPFLQHVVDKARNLAPASIYLVVGHGAEMVNQHFTQKDIHSVVQAQQLGTGHAVAQVLEHLANNSVVLILYGDVPLIQQATLEALVQKAGAGGGVDTVGRAAFALCAQGGGTFGTGGNSLARKAVGRAGAGGHSR